MYKINEDLSIYVTRGDTVLFDVKANDADGTPHTFMPGDLVRIKVYKKKKADEVVLQKDFHIATATQKVQIYLSKEDTKIGEVISKPVTYWYSIALINPDNEEQTIIGYDDETGAKTFVLLPEGGDKVEEDNEQEVTPPENVDNEIDINSTLPVSNQAVARWKLQVEAAIEAMADKYVTPEFYGAIGDGEADDTEAFRKAIQDGEKTTIRIGNKAYRISEQIDITKDMSVVSDFGTIIGNGFCVQGANVKFSGITFRDISTNAIVAKDGAAVTVERCSFENVGTSNSLDVTYEGCAIYADGCSTKVVDATFEKCHGHGAIFIYNGGYVEIKDSRFTENDYRAIMLYGSGRAEGTIARNHIEDCGKNNNTGSGAGCNGIYSTNGYDITIEGNTIINSRENAIEGVFLKVADNYIDGTGVEVDTKPTPSIEGIFILPKQTSYVARNTILNARGYGIKSYSDGAITEHIFIIGNVIKDSGSGAIDINSPVSVSNVHIIDNVVDGTVNINNSDDTVVYVGEIAKLNGKPDITKNNAVFDYHHYFDTLSPFTSSNCSPEFLTGSDGVSYMSVAYQEYAKVIYSLPALKGVRHLLRFSLLGKGKFNVNLTKNGAYYQNILSIDSATYVEKHYTLPVNASISDKFKIQIEFQAASCIKTVDIQLYR